MEETGKLILCDYAVAFIDLLGQKDAMRERNLPADPDEALQLVKRSVGKIVGIQKHFQAYFDAFTSQKSLYESLPNEIQSQLPDFARGELKWQRFSDGFVIFIPLGEGAVKAPANSIFGMLMAAGCHCLTGLAARSPLRVGIDVAWAVEYRPGELYGSAVAHAYELESKVARWPRVVIGDGLVGYLEYYADSRETHLSAKARTAMARTCLEMITPDTDGQNMLHYLGKPFRSAAGSGVNEELIEEALKYTQSQLSHWSDVRNAKLKSRYTEVSAYLRGHSGG